MYPRRREVTGRSTIPSDLVIQLCADLEACRMADLSGLPQIFERQRRFHGILEEQHTVGCIDGPIAAARHTDLEALCQRGVFADP
jgi:hypothetical protein